MTGKLWRTRVRPLVLNLILFGLGVTTCLMFIQMSNNEIDSPIVYTNPQEYHAAAQIQSQKEHQLMQTQQEPPCDNANLNSNNNAGLSSKSHINSVNPAAKSESRYVSNNNVNPDIPNEYDTTRVKADGSERPLSKISKRLILSSKSGIENPENDILSENARTKDSTSFRNNLVHNHVDDIEGEVDTEDDTFQKNPQKSGPTVWVITPTFYRPEQKAELTRLAQALLPVRRFIHWILVDDVTHGSDGSFQTLENFMKRFPSINYTLLKSFPPKSGTKIVGKPRGVGGRRAAIEWLRKLSKDSSSKMDGVVYFADDDNTYDSELFLQMQNTKKVSMWPVGLVTELGVSSPIVKNGRVVGFYDGWNGLRKFPVDMAGFAINIQLFLDKPLANMPWTAGYEEDELLRSLGIKIQDIQPLANNCTEILVWHTKAVRNVWPKRPKNLKPSLAVSTNLNYLLNSLPQKSLAGLGANQSKSDSGFSLLNFFFGGT